MSEQNESYGVPQELVVEITTIQPRLYGFILKRLADHEQALEVLQDTNLMLCQKAGEFQKGSSFAAWAFTIAKFQVMAWRKSESRSRLVFTDEVHELLDREADEEVSDVDRRIPVLKRCLERLREQERSLIQRRYCDGETVQALAQSLEKTVDATGMRLLRIRKRLGDCIRARLGQEVEYGV